MTTKPSPARAKLYQLLSIGKKQLGFDDDLYRAFLAQYGATAKEGRISATTMTITQLAQAVEAMKQKGFTPKAKSAARGASEWRQPMIEKITALWCRLADAGVAHDRSEVAMVKWCSRVTKKARLQWASAPDLSICIESLKKWAQREGVNVNG